MGSGAWARLSLLVMFHNETWGGEKVFQLLARLAEDPAGNRDLLELMHVVLALGFEVHELPGPRSGGHLYARPRRPHPVYWRNSVC